MPLLILLLLLLATPLRAADCPTYQRLQSDDGRPRCIVDSPLLLALHGGARDWVPHHGLYSVAASPPQCPPAAGVGRNNNSPVQHFVEQRDAMALAICNATLKRSPAAGADCRCQLVVRSGLMALGPEEFDAFLRLSAPPPRVEAAPQTVQAAPAPLPARAASSPESAASAPPPLAAQAEPRWLEAAPAGSRPGVVAGALQALPPPAAASRSLQALPLRLPEFAAPAPPLNPRRALVIGNRDYLVGALRNPLNDARALAAELRRLRFEVSLVENLRRDDIAPTLDRFVDAIRAGDDVLVFYAGHGLQLKGVNYLPAVDARIRSETDVPLNSINLNQLIERLDESKAAVRLLLIDACRDNPYARSFRSGGQGLARVSSAPVGTLMHFATRPGGVAADGEGPHGLYTAHLLRHLGRPGEPVERVLKAVAAAVRQASGGAQQPWMEGGIEGEFYFAPASP